MNKMFLSLMIMALPVAYLSAAPDAECCKTKEMCCKDTCCKATDNCCKSMPRKACAKVCTETANPHAHKK